MVSSKVAIINGKSMDVYNEKQLFENKNDLLDSDSASLEIKNTKGDICILPIKSNKCIMDKPGVYVGSKTPFAQVVFPETKEDKDIYIPSEEQIVDFSNITTMQDVISAHEHINDVMNQFLESDTENGNVFKPPLLDTDTPEMRGLKQCIIEKKVEIDKYADRFGSNFPNDKRKLKESEISLYLLKRMAENLDINVDIVFKDSKGSIPNPMNKTITVNLVPGENVVPIIEDKWEE